MVNKGWWENRGLQPPRKVCNYRQCQSKCQTEICKIAIESVKHNQIIAIWLSNIIELQLNLKFLVKFYSFNCVQIYFINHYVAVFKFDWFDKSNLKTLWNSVDLIGFGNNQKNLKSWVKFDWDLIAQNNWISLIWIGSLVFHWFSFPFVS